MVSLEWYSCQFFFFPSLEGKKLFKDVGPFQVQEYDELSHLGHISALSGPPPKRLLDKGTRTNLF